MKDDIFDELKKINAAKSDKLDKLKQISEQNNLNEFIGRYRTDPVGFTEKVGSWYDSTLGMVKPTLFQHQKELLQAFHDEPFHVVHQARQLGLTQTFASSVLHYAYFNTNKRVMVMGYNNHDTEHLFRKIRDDYHNLPEIYKQLNPVVRSTRFTMEFQNGTIIESTSARSSKILFGCNIDYLIMDNFGILHNTQQDAILQAIMPRIRQMGCKVVIGSTGCGSRSVGTFVQNSFLRLWKDAFNGLNMFTPHSASWQENPNWDDNWKKEQINQMGEKAWKAEYEVVIKDDQKWQEQKMPD